MKQEIKTILDFLSQPLDKIFKNINPGEYALYFGYNLTMNNCYVGINCKNKTRIHKKSSADLFGKVQFSEQWKIVCVNNLTKENAHVLEAFLIKFLSETCGLHDKGAKNIVPNKALNKKRERSWENQISTSMIDGNHDICLIKR